MTENETNQPTVLKKTIRLTSDGIKYELEIRMGFDEVGKSQLLAWAFADRIITAQRVLRECSAEALNDYATNGFDVHALAAGTKPVSAAETKAQLKAQLASLSQADRDALLAELIG